jgi:hypothetical protein
MEDIVVRDVLTGVVHGVAGAARHYRERASWGWCGIKTGKGWHEARVTHTPAGTVYVAAREAPEVPVTGSTRLLSTVVACDMHCCTVRTQICRARCTPSSAAAPGTPQPRGGMARKALTAGLLRTASIVVLAFPSLRAFASEVSAPHRYACNMRSTSPWPINDWYAVARVAGALSLLRWLTRSTAWCIWGWGPWIGSNSSQ